MTREEHYVGRSAMEIKYKGEGTEEGLRKYVWTELKEKGQSAEQVYDRATLRRMSSYSANNYIILI